MHAETLFAAANMLALAGWIALIAAPRRRWVTHFLCALAIPGVLGAGYVALILANLGSLQGGFGTLADVARLFDNPWVLLAGWVHYLAFDLFIGAWQVRESQRLGIRHRWVVPCLVLTFVFGPMGLLLYFLVRGIARREGRVGDPSYQVAETM